MGNVWTLLGVLIVIVGFVLKFDTLATVVVAGVVTGLIGGLSPMEILNTLGESFITNRTATLFVLTLPVIGMCERYGLRDKATDFIRKLKNATTVPDRQEVEHLLKEQVNPGDIVLVCGARDNSIPGWAESLVAKI